MENEITECFCYRFPPGFEEEALGVLRRHGAIVFEELDQYKIFFPDHAIRNTVIDLALQTHYKILFPDGLSLDAVVTHGSTVYHILIPKAEVPPRFHKYFNFVCE